MKEFSIEVIECMKALLVTFINELFLFNKFWK
jgi:hypothetical protein